MYDCDRVIACYNIVDVILWADYKGLLPYWSSIGIKYAAPEMIHLIIVVLKMWETMEEALCVSWWAM